MGATWPIRDSVDPQFGTLYAEGEIIAGKYQLKRVLGAGGMGAVWLATNTILEVDVAIKLLHADFAGQEEASQRFLHEARATAKLRHPGIVRLHDFGTTRRGHAFMVMEHLRGESLASILDVREKIAPIESVQLLLQVLDALDLAHEHGVVHRDLKPENILVIRSGDTFTCKVVDFGIAKMTEAPELPPLNTESVESVVQRTAKRLTQHGALLGSPEYMSPEQTRGARDVDHRADLWGLSVVLYECIHGERPFGDASLDLLLMSVLIDEPERLEEVDDALWRIIAKGLAKEREDRWQDASDFGEALAQWLVDNGVQVDASGQSLGSRWLGEASIADQSQPLSAVTITPASELPRLATATRQGRPNTALTVAGALAVCGAVGLGGYVLLSGGADDRPASALPSPQLPGTSTERVERAGVPALAPEQADAAPASANSSASSASSAAGPSSAAGSSSPVDAPPRAVPHASPKVFPRAAPPTPTSGDGLALPSGPDF